MQPEHNWMKYVLNEQSDFIHQFNIQATKKMKKYLVKSQMYRKSIFSFKNDLTSLCRKSQQETLSHFLINQVDS